jgi:hypothetical protein
MQTITLSKTEQALVQAVVSWADEQRQVVNNLAIEKLSSIIEEKDLSGKTCSFDKQEDGSWVITLSQEVDDAAEEGKL